MLPANTRGRSGPGKGLGVGIGEAGLPGTQHILHGDAQGSAASPPTLTGEFNTTADAQKVFLYISDNQRENTSRQGVPHGFLPGLTHLHPVRGCHPGLTQPHEQGMGLPNRREKRAHHSREGSTRTTPRPISELTGVPRTTARAPLKTQVGEPTLPDTRVTKTARPLHGDLGPGGHTAWPPLSRFSPGPPPHPAGALTWPDSALPLLTPRP